MKKYLLLKDNDKGFTHLKIDIDYVLNKNGIELA